MRTNTYTLDEARAAVKRDLPDLDHEDAEVLAHELHAMSSDPVLVAKLAELDADPNANPLLGGLSYDQFAGGDAITPEDCGHCDGSHWGLDDLYPEWEIICRRAHARWAMSRKPFTLRWGSKKEIWFASVCGCHAPDAEIIVSATVETDEERELFDDLIWATSRIDGFPDPCEGREALELYGIDQDRFDALYDARTSEEPLCSSFTARRTLPPEATWEDIMEALDAALGEADDSGEEAHDTDEENLHCWLLDIAAGNIIV